ncbi:MAG: response regulator transcription factor [Flavobacteriales bacterium]|nr:response regulator transcription factor [Flavobacteriales bacterium]
MSGQTIRIALCDDHRIVTEGMKELLSGSVDLACVGIAQSGIEAQYLLEHLKVDVLLTDLDMPGMDGAQLTSWVKNNRPEVKVIVLSMHEEASIVKRLMELGASGYLVKSAGKEEVLLAIRNVHGGQRHFSSGLLESIMKESSVAANGVGRLHELSEREVEVLSALAEGLGNKEIGEKLFISPRTVDTHRTNLMRKLNVHNVAGLVRIAIAEGLVK